MVKLLKRFEKNEKTLQELERAKERFREKNSYESFKPLQTISKVAQATLPLFSIFTGIFALSTILNAFIPIYLCFVLAVLFLAIWERMKCFLLIKNFELLYSNGNRINLGLAVSAIIFAVGSIILSVSGANSLSKQMDSTEETISADFRLKKDSLLTLYTHKIDDAKKAAKSYFEKNSYKGVIRYAKDERYAKQYNSMVERITELEKQKDNSLIALKEQNSQELKFGKRDYENLTYSFLAITVVVELLIIAANWFVVFFDHRIYTEERLLTSRIANKISTSQEEIVNLFQSYLMPKLLSEQSLAASAPASTGSIGFQTTFNKSASDQEESRENQENDLLSAANEQDLIQEIKAGKRDYRSLMKKYKVNVLTLKNYIESYG